MNQLESLNKKSVILRKFNNKIATYTDILSDRGDTISYLEIITPDEGKEIIKGMEYEDYVDIFKKDLKGLTFNQILIFLRNTTPDKRIEKFKKFLIKRNIKFESDLFTWVS